MDGTENLMDRIARLLKSEMAYLFRDEKTTEDVMIAVGYIFLGQHGLSIFPQEGFKEVVEDGKVIGYKEDKK